ncbi:hypothetical protein GE21DRAFT_4380 [Neurospora crassa]|uniref:Uncharacterized protein n=1 Tax=Neurospora crassa (strain ATCC 24698 / 74-OR23-1A / CBS 708.71 / DSM 1257 / FGSC 987) TaxID=367110 RepID=Q7RYM9_NEUCR|nr:hypothetical protein NCU00099 [Neurospora crassa OR74A]EAA27987.1 hypothetical protein NCU00099 [Neurospora crassa OR74A]KHE89507.1 hypothetical protein GE21DRAFT_4380 [Neurospora crassa]|eukprot:XP_957223.1 hypothetical protein NCU00099 [Neurospora crassa OR74A]
MVKAICVKADMEWRTACKPLAPRRRLSRNAFLLATHKISKRGPVQPALDDDEYI